MRTRSLGKCPSKNSQSFKEHIERDVGQPTFSTAQLLWVMSTRGGETAFDSTKQPKSIPMAVFLAMIEEDNY